MIIENIEIKHESILVRFTDGRWMKCPDDLKSITPRYINHALKTKDGCLFSFFKSYFNSMIGNFSNESLSELYQNEFNIKKFIKDYNVELK